MRLVTTAGCTILVLAVSAGAVLAADRPPAEEDVESISDETPAATEETPWPPFQAIDAGAGLSFHRTMYGMPLTTSNVYNGKETEILFQLSAKLRILGSHFFLAYTQDSFWQAFNRDASAPFRETDYNPEVFYRLVPSNSALRHWGVDLGVEHQSNGQSEPDSRSWNRATVTLHRVAPRWLVSLKGWYRFPEKLCPIGEDGMELERCRDDAGYDDNPDITDYTGYGELHLHYQWRGHGDVQHLHAMLRGNFATGKGAVELDYSHPSGSKDLHWFARLFHGYGESLIDYDRSVTRLGIGIALRR